MFCKRLRAMMPQDSLQLALTTGFGFSVLAGIFSGVVYIISVGYNKTKRAEKPNTPWHCTFCGAQFHSIDGVLEHENVVTCMKCARTFCKDKCATRPSAASIAFNAEEEAHGANDDSRRSSYSAIERWICKKCQPDSWISGIVRLLQFNETKEWYTKKMTTEQAQINAELTALQRKEREQVRDFIERLVEALLGGELDNVSVKKIYNDERYDAIYARYHGDLSSALTDLGSALHITISNLPIAGESPCEAHASLKTLIQRFIREASELPELRKADEQHPALLDDINDRTYEDLHATAIINKVVQSFQDKPPSVAGSSSSKSKRSTSDKEYFLGERNLDGSSKFDDTSSLSSLDDYINTNGSTKYLDQMNFAIQQQSIKEVSSSDEDEVNYDIDDVDSASARNQDWQENWYLRKRNFGSGTNSPVPVPMLVPNPNTTENAKVLIGDREVDDTSDLSDAASDYEDSVEPSSLNAFLLNSKNLIGGRNPLVSIGAKAESIADNDDELDQHVEENVEYETRALIHHDAESRSDVDVVDFTSADDKDAGSEIIETCNMAFIRDPHHVDLGACGDVEDQLISLESNTEKDSEYTEKYATLPRKIPMPTPRQSKLTDIDFSKTALLIEDSKTDNGDSGVTSDEDDKQKNFKSSAYGEREKDKWNHAVDLPNNPYSKSNLENRLSNRSSSISSLNSVENLLDTEVCEVQNSVVLADMETPPLPETPQPEMSKSLFDVLNDDRKGYQHRYGRDYFAKAAGKPQGALKKSWLDDDDQPRDGDDADDEERKIEVVDDPIVPQENIFRATPAIIHLDEEDNSNIKAEEPTDDVSSIEVTTPSKRVQPWDLSSDSDYSIERTYNVDSGKIIKKLGDVEYEVPIAEVPTAEGLKYTQLDENENSSSPKTPKLAEVQKKRSNFLRSLTLEDEDAFNDDDHLDESVEITPPAVNHFKLVNEIANETVEQYKVEPISPPAEYKNAEAVDKPTSIEYESEEKSYDFSIESTFDEEERLKAQQQADSQDAKEIVEETFTRGIIAPIEPTLGQGSNITSVDSSTYEIVEDSVCRRIIEVPHVNEVEPHVIEDTITRGIIEADNLIDVEQEDVMSENEVLTSNALNKMPNNSFISNTRASFEVEHAATDPDEPGIEELLEKHIVKNTLGTFAKSFPNLSNTKYSREQPVKSIDQVDMLSLSSDVIANSMEIEEASQQSVHTVRDLKQKFEKDSDAKKDVEVHSSLTARSVPKQMRQQLAEAKHEEVEKPRRNSMLSESSTETLDAHESDAIVAPIQTEHKEAEPEVISFPKARSRIAFFEQMSQK